ncbi:MAG: NAD(P)-binding protein [Pseudomonadota bacterium]
MPDNGAILRKLAEGLDFDPVELKKKYEFERDRRVTPKGNEQYTEVDSQFARFENEDPYVAEPLERDPLTAETEVLIVGAGFSGLMAGARLKEKGIEDIMILDAAADFGGTWYWNRYPGAQCDVDAYCYLPLLEETGYMPKEKYSFADEIFDHSRRIAKHFNLYDKRRISDASN